MKYFQLIRTLGFKNFFRKGLLFLKKRIGIDALLQKKYSLKSEKINGIRVIDHFQDGVNQLFSNQKFTQKHKDLFLKSLDHNQSIIDSVLDFKVKYFTNQEVNIGPKVNFNKDYVDDITWEVGKHSSKYFQFDKSKGDIKRVWEINRLQYLNPLILPGILEDKNSKKFIVEFLKDWLNQNPANSTVAWACSQEISIRTIGMLYSLQLLKINSSNLEVLHNAIYISALHVKKEIGYAQAQRNNHAITEGVFLVLFSHFYKFKGSERFGNKGEEVLLNCIEDQFFDDGTYIQSSHTYHRFALQSLTLIYPIAAPKLKQLIRLAMKRSLSFLSQLVVNEKGNFPNYGPNDTAMLYNFGCTDARDLRPLINTLSYIVNGSFAFKQSETMIDTLVLFPESINSDVKSIVRESATSFPFGGYYNFHKNELSVFFRSGSYDSYYPNQCDMLHVDVWYKGDNVLIDSGTYEYYSPNNIDNYRYFLSTEAHNTIKINDLNQMEKGERFTWYSKLSAKGKVISDGIVEGEHYGYIDRVSSKPIHKRKVEVGENELIVTDEIVNAQNLPCTLYWHFGKHIEVHLDGNSINSPVLDLFIDCEIEVVNEIIERDHSLYYGSKFTSQVLKTSFKPESDTISIKSYFKFK